MTERSWKLGTRLLSQHTFVRGSLIAAVFDRANDASRLLAWDLATGGPRWEVATALPFFLCVSHDQTWVATFDAEAIRWWDLPTGQVLRTFQQRAHVVAALPGDVLLCLGNGSIFALSVRTGQVEKLFFVGDTHQVAVDAAGERLACVVDRKKLVGFDLHTRKQLFSVATKEREAVVFRPHHAELVLPDLWDGPRVIDAATGNTLAELKGAATQGCPTCALSPDGRWLATLHGDQPDNHAPWDDLCIRVWNLEGRTLRRTVELGLSGPPAAVRIGNDQVVEAVHTDGDWLSLGRYLP